MAACHAGGLSSIPGLGQTTISMEKLAVFCNTASGGTLLALQLGVIFDSSGDTAAQAATVEHESDRP
jgi:hypothetical protein